MNKPLGHKAYGSIPHLPGSRLGPGDHHCEEGQARIATERVRDKHDIIIVQEKLDGSNCSVAKVNDQIIALGRAGYRAESSNYEQHQIFAKWVKDNEILFDDLLEEGERVVGEWLAMAHGTRYKLKHIPFVPFDIMVKAKRQPYNIFATRVKAYGLPIPNLLHHGASFSIESALKAIEHSGHGAIDPVEGAVWRVERKGVVDFLCKYVRHDKEDGKYFAEKNGGKITWNIEISNNSPQ